MAEASARVVISAITEAAEESIEDVGDELTGLADDGAIGAAGTEQVADEFRDLVVLAALVANALDDVEDELGATGRSAAATSGSFAALSLSSQGASVSVGTLSTALTASLLPALAAVATLIGPLVAGLTALAAGGVALAGAFGAVIGSGILAFGAERAAQNRERLQQVSERIQGLERLREQFGGLTAEQREQLQTLKDQQRTLEDQTSITGALEGAVADLREELQPLIVEFGEDFQPLVEDAIEAVPGLVREILAAVGSLDEFRATLRAFGAAGADTLPLVVGFLADLARESLPLLREVVGFLADQGPGAFRALLASAAELEPGVRNVIDALVESGPALLEFGTFLATIALPALAELIRLAGDAASFVNGLPSPIREVTTASIALAPVLATVASGLVTLIGAVSGTAGLSAVLSTLGTIISGVVSALLSIPAAIAVATIGILQLINSVEDNLGPLREFRELVGGERIDQALGAVNLATGGRLEDIAEVGVTAADVASLEGDFGAEERRRVRSTFDRGERSIERQINNTTVNVDQRGNILTAPDSASRRIAETVQREARAQPSTRRGG